MNARKKKYNLPAGYSLIQTTLKSNEFLNDPVKFISKSMDKFSGTYTATLGMNRKLILTQNPDFINYILKENHKNYHKSELSTESAVKFFGNGLLFSNGDYWLRQRRLIQPAFHRQKIQGLNDIVIKSINDFLPKFPTGESIDIYPLVNRLSFNILIKSLFDINIPSQVMEELSRIFSDLQDFLIKDINQPLRRIFYPLTGTENTNLKKAKRLREIFRGIIRQRKSSNESYVDLLDMLLNSKYEDTREAMSEEQILDEVVIIIFAGHETTANTLSWLLYLIASDNAVLQKLTASLENITIDQCLTSEYLKAVINEAMRLYPAAWMTERVALEDDQYGEFSFPANTIIIPFFVGLHRDKNLWPDALKFTPERFIADTKAAKSKNYFPFGAGPRMCIGNNFAIMEMSFFIYAFLKEFQIKPTGQIPAMKALITLRPGKVILGIKKK
jgi:cytochrome P450